MDDSNQKPDHRAEGRPPSRRAAPQPAAPTGAPTPRPKATIMDLARYRVGQRVYWVVFRFDRNPEFERAEDWMRREHPWMLWRHKIVPSTVPMKPPRAHPGDTFTILMLMAQKPRIEPFRITEVERSANSGSFLYTGPKGTVMPEGLLFPSRAAASKEVARVAKIFAEWTGSWEAAAESPPKKDETRPSSPVNRGDHGTVPRVRRSPNKVAMPTTHVNYHGLPFPCSRAGVKPPPTRFSARQLVTGCDLAALLRMGRPADEEIRLIWMQRFIDEMHWLPLIEALSGCHPDTDPAAHAAFVAALASRDVPRIAHRPWGKGERHMWGAKLDYRIKPLCPDSSVWRSVKTASVKFEHGTSDAFFVAADAIAAAEEARPACLSDTPWLLYKAVRVIRGQLPEDEHRVMMGSRIGGDLSAEAYFRFLDQGTL